METRPSKAAFFYVYFFCLRAIISAYPVKIFKEALFIMDNKKDMKNNKMGKQTISCDVKSCRYNMETECACALSEIHVAPKKGCCSQTEDESLCSSYRCKNCN